MTDLTINSWQDVRQEVRRRIHAREWQPGALIPNEIELAAEFGCARATVNRALRDLAEAGLLDRRRKAGTRVALHPVGRATLHIPVIREEVSGRGQAYAYALVSDREAQADSSAFYAKGLRVHAPLRMVSGLHLADGVPLVVEERWISLEAVPQAQDVDFSVISANEWLLANAPFTRGDITFSASKADAQMAELLEIEADAALFTVERTTWDGDRVLTAVKLSYRPGYRMESSI